MVFVVPSGGAGPPGPPGPAGPVGPPGPAGSAFLVGGIIALPVGAPAVANPGAFLTGMTTVVHDPNGMSNGTGGLVIPETGVWELIGHVLYSAASDELLRACELYRGATVIGQDFRVTPPIGAAAQQPSPRVAIQINLTAGDVITLRAFHNVPVSTTIIGTASTAGTHLSAMRVA
jgi:hypothetical protein